MPSARRITAGPFHAAIFGSPWLPWLALALGLGAIGLLWRLLAGASGAVTRVLLFGGPLVALLFAAALGLAQAAAKRARAAEAAYRELFEANPHPMWVYDTRTLAFLAVNNAAVRHYGYSRDDFLALTIRDIRPPEDVPRLIAQIAEHGDGLYLAGLSRHRKQDGSLIDVEVTSHVLEFGGHPAQLVLAHDVTEQKRSERALQRANRALRTISECSQALVRATDEAQLLSDICRLVVEFGGYRLAWVGLAEEDSGRSVRPVAQAGFDAGYLQAARISWADTERGRGPTGTAIRERRVVASHRIEDDPLYGVWREGAQQRGYASSLALPLQDDARCLGALNIYSSEPDAFDAEEQQLLTELANDLAFGIRALRGQSPWVGWLVAWPTTSTTCWG